MDAASFREARNALRRRLALPQSLYLLHSPPPPPPPPPVRRRGPIVWVLGAEVQTLDTRTSGMSAVVFANYISSFIIGGGVGGGGGERTAGSLAWPRPAPPARRLPGPE